MASKPPGRPPPPKVIVPGSQTPLSVRHHFEHLQLLGPTRVRWFYQEDKKWIPFRGKDSLEIEKTFQELPEALRFPLLIPNDVDRSSIPLPTVRGSLYEVDILDRECRAIYWKENPCPITRGTWFKGNLRDNWEPIDEKQALKIEEAHLQVVRSLGVGEPVDLVTSDNENEIQKKVDGDLEDLGKIGKQRVEWHDLSEVYMISETTGSRLAQKFGMSGATELHRGYEYECKVNDCLKEVSHIVFLIHGMGQLYHTDGGIVNSRKKFADSTSKTMQRHFKDHIEDEERTEFFPIEWRTKLRLDEGIIGTITPSNLGSLRKVINDTTLDVFYYTSPFYREEIIQAMRAQLNGTYQKFCDRNPDFQKNNGKVSIIAHSLGSVIIHDVLTLWNSNLMEKGKSADVNVAGGERSYSWFWGWGKPKESTSNESCSSDDTEEKLRKQLHEARLKVAKIENKINGFNISENAACDRSHNDCYSLKFKVENVFNIGSPLGVFLIMRGIRPRDDVEQHILPKSVCKRTFNIYDPADPVAYRLEPLIYDYYADVPPVRLAHVKNASKPGQPVLQPPSGGGWGIIFRSILGSTSQPVGAQNAASVEYQKSGKVELPKGEDEKAKAVLSDKKVLSPRIDYVLETSMVEYFSAITSHQSYWQNQDFAKFVLNRIFSEEDEHDTDSTDDRKAS